MSRCFILGAGFSKPCGLPLASELTALVFEHAFPKNDIFRPDVREYWVKFLQHLYPQDDLETVWPDFEDLITVIDEWSICQGEYEGRDRNDEPLSPPHFKRMLLRSLALLLCEKAVAAPRDSIEEVKEFVNGLDKSVDTLISFNWDPLIEIACAEIGVDVSYTDRGHSGLRMAKPHGSVTLAEMSRSEFKEASICRNVHDVYIDWEKGDVVVIRADNPPDAADRIVNPFEKTVLVEPTVRKVYSSPWIKLQWRNAYDMVTRADEIHVIGFSLPPTDYRPRILLQAAMFDRTPAPSLQIIDPNAEKVAERFREVLNIDVRSVPSCWEKWLYIRV